MRYIYKISRILLLLVSIFTIMEHEGAVASSQKSQKLVCVEAVWCDIAMQIGGDLLEPTSILYSTAIEPHHFTPTPKIMKQMREADILLMNGAHYDDWAWAFHGIGQASFVASELVSWKEGEDPHLFFDFDAVHQMAQNIALFLIKKYPEKKNILLERKRKFEETLVTLKERQKQLSLLKKGKKIALIEPAGLRLLQPLKFDIIDQKWAFDMMNDQVVSPRDTALLERDIHHKVIVFLVTNPVIKGGLSENIIAQAAQEHIPFIEVSEYLPPQMSWQKWIEDIYRHIEAIQ